MLTPGHGGTKTQEMPINERIHIADRRSDGDTHKHIVHSGGFWPNTSKCSRVEG